MLKPLHQLVKEAAQELHKLQKGEIKILKTGMPCIDDHIGGLLKGDIIVTAALSGHGKSEFLYKLKESVLSEEVNEGASNFAFIDYSLEMKVFNQYVRGLKRATGKAKKSILFEEFSGEDLEKAIEYYKKLVKDPRVYINQDPITPLELYKECREFLQENRDKEAVIISIDHILLVSGSDKKSVIDEVMEYLNRLKLEFDNVYFVVLSQMNRSILNRVAEKNNASIPNTGDLYGSEFMTQTASYVITLLNAYKVGINQYMKVFPERYDYLAEHFGDDDSKSGKVSFDTVGKIFIHVLKVREGESVYKDLFIEDMGLSEDDKGKLRKASSDSDSTPPPIEIPRIEFTNTPALQSARGAGFEDVKNEEDEGNDDFAPF